MVDSKESKTTSWFKRFIGREQKPEVTWSFSFAEGRVFVLTLRAGIDGFHINVGGWHVTSFPYRPGFTITIEDARGLAITGDVDIHSVYAISLSTSHPSFSPVRFTSPLPRNDEKRSGSGEVLAGEYYDEMRTGVEEGGDLKSKKEVDWDEEENTGGEKMNLWKMGLHGIGAMVDSFYL